MTKRDPLERSMEGRRSGERRHGNRRSAAAPSPAPEVPVVQVTGDDGHPWALLAHPAFLDQLAKVRAKAAIEPTGPDLAPGPATKLLGHLLDLMFVAVPRDPGHKDFRHGGALGGGHRDWFRAKTGNGRFRLFYRYSSKARVIVFGWLNDETTLRTYGAKTDAYAVFTDLLADGNPPDDWDALVAQASASKAVQRLQSARQARDQRG